MHRWVSLVASQPRCFLRPEPRPFLPPKERRNRRLPFVLSGSISVRSDSNPGLEREALSKTKGSKKRHGSIDEPDRSHDDPCEGLGFDRTSRTVDDVWRICASRRGWNAKHARGGCVAGGRDDGKAVCRREGPSWFDEAAPVVHTSRPVGWDEPRRWNAGPDAKLPPAARRQARGRTVQR